MRAPIPQNRITTARVGDAGAGIGFPVFMFVIAGAFIYFLYKLADHVD